MHSPLQISLRMVFDSQIPASQPRTVQDILLRCGYTVPDSGIASHTVLHTSRRRILCLYKSYFVDIKAWNKN